MNRHAALLFFLSMAAPIVGESAVYKCTAAGGETVYQDTRCTAGQSQVALTASPAKRDQIAGTEAAPEPASAQEMMPGTGTALAAGMSDTKVLNMRGWGRPQKITRSRSKDGWREEWTYLSRAEEKRTLQFVNGMLTAAISEPLFQESNRLAAVASVVQSSQ